MKETTRSRKWSWPERFSEEIQASNKSIIWRIDMEHLYKKAGYPDKDNLADNFNLHSGTRGLGGWMPAQIMRPESGSNSFPERIAQIVEVVFYCYLFVF